MLIVFVSYFLVSSCRPITIIAPSTEIGEVEIYGFIENGIIPDNILVRIKDKNPAIVSKGFLFHYWRMKRLLEINEIEIYYRRLQMPIPIDTIGASAGAGGVLVALFIKVLPALINKLNGNGKNKRPET